MQEQHAESQLTWLQERAIEDAYDRKKKKLWLAYLLAVPLGCIGAHRFYLGRTRSGWMMLGLWLMGFLVAWAIAAEMPDRATTAAWDTAAGLLMLSTWGWEMLDFFLIPGMVRRFNAGLGAEMKRKLHAGEAL